MYYQCVGEIRGPCPHKHRTKELAFQCLEKDRQGCEMQGGYSDRYVVVYSDNGEPISYVDEED